MRHHVSQKKLGRKKGQRDALLASLARSLVLHEYIDTTLTRAKALRPYIERLITTAGKDTLHARRQIAQKLGDGKVLKKIMNDIAPRYTNRPGGYTRIIKLPTRSADAAERARIEFVE